MSADANRWLIGLVLAGGVAYTLLLQAPIRGEVFNVGDNGLKALMTRQFAAGRMRPDLSLRAPAWIEALWADGLFPYQSPFVYEVDGRRFIRFPLAFPLFSAPAYALSGYRGLYVLPLLSTWAVWLAFVAAGRRLRFDTVAQALALAALEFGSPLTYYSATFWEHPTAVALAFAGTLLIALGSPRGHSKSIGAGPLFTGGLLVGSSVWFREELMVLVGLLGAAVLAPAAVRRRLSRTHLEPRSAILAGLALPLGAFMAFNQATYGHPLGVHALNVVEAMGAASPRAIVAAAGEHWASLIHHAPVLLFALLALAGRRFRRLPRSGLFLALLGLALAVLTGVLLPVRGKEWGPRYLLGAVPLLYLAAGLALARGRRVRGSLRHVETAAFAALVALGAYRNAYLGARHLAANYEQRLVPYRAVAADPARVVAVSHEFVAQQLAALTRDKALVLATRGADLRRLARAAAAAAEPRFLYVCDPNYPCGPLGDAVPSLTFYDGGGRPFLHLQSRGAFERYLIYDARVPAERIRQQSDHLPPPHSAVAPPPAARERASRRRIRSCTLGQSADGSEENTDAASAGPTTQDPRRSS